MRKSIFKKIKFKKSFVEDFLFSVEAIKKGMKVKIIDKFLVTQAKPKTFSELRKIYLRHTQGFLSDILPNSGQFAPVYLFVAIMFILGLPLSYFSIQKGDTIFATLGIVNYIFIFITLVLVSNKERKLRYILHLPYLLIGIVTLNFFIIEGLARKVFRREYFNYEKTPGWVVQKI